MLQFQTFILNWYKLHGRHDLPWRQTTDPYHIMVSEIMLQQTQVERVIPKYLAFLNSFPTIEKLATAPQSTVIKHWQGLGYNRRGLNLHKAANFIMTAYEGQLPQTTEELTAIPGIGPYTAAAIQAFAFNLPSIVIETNIRTVFLYHFFPQHDKVSDQGLVPYISQALFSEKPREWYSALMDYGAFLKRVLPNPSRKSKHHTKQSTFKGSLRQSRGAIINLLTLHDTLSTQELLSQTPGLPATVKTALTELENEGFISRKENFYYLK
jgi:A/G-specific adenine glycosylase